MKENATSAIGSAQTARLPLWVTITVVLGALLLTIGAVISKFAPIMLTNGDPMTSGARVFADYTFARDLPLAFMLLFLLAIKESRLLAGLMVVVALTQILDMLNDLARGELFLIPIVLLFAVAFIFGASRLFGQAIWHTETWRTSHQTH